MSQENEFLTQFQSSMDKLDNVKSSIQTTIEMREQFSNNLKGRLSQINQRIKDLTNLITNLKNSVDNLKNTVQTTTTSIDDREKQLELLQQRITQLETEKQTAVEQLNQQKSELENTMTQQQAKIDTLETQLREITNNKATIESEKNALQSELLNKGEVQGQTAEQIKMLSEESQQRLEQQQNELTQKITDCDSKIANFEQQLKAKDEQLNKLNQDYQNQQNVAAQTAQDLQSQIYKLTTYNETLKYPESYEGNDYTVIKMLRYVADPNVSLGGNPEVETTEQGDSEAVTNLSLTRFSERKEEILATINLPIPSNLIDANPVSWESGDLGPLRAYGVTAAANILNSGNFSTGVGNEVGRAARTVQANGESARTVLNASIIGAVLGMSGNDILTRSTGAILNPNTELLFRGPQLRTWNFSFKMTPRNDKEAKTIRKIIRWLKQGSSVKRAGNGIFLASPNVFKIEFKHVRHDGKNVTDSIEDHPFLPRIKPSALQSISVNYMPDGSYMTYGDGSMVGYEMTLNFQEIEPIFDEDYDKLDEQGPDTTIGF